MDVVTAIESLEEPIEGLGNQARGSAGEGVSFEERLASLKASLAKRKIPKISGITRGVLDNLNVVLHSIPLLDLKPGHEERAVAARHLGEENLWSSLTFHQHLELLNGVVTYENEANARLWIDAFFFRVSAMVQSDKCMVLDLEQAVPQIVVEPSTSTAYSVFNDYDDVPVIASKYRPRVFLSFPPLEKLGTTMPSVFFITEVKVKSIASGAYISQAIGEMYACLKSIEKDILRGALTNGHEWIFLIIMLNPDGNGAKYRCSPPVMFDHPQIRDIWPDLVAGILSHWVENSFADIGSNDWFEVPLYM